MANLLAARDGTLWIGTYKGLASWKDGKLTRYPEIAGQRVDTLLEDREGTIWAGVETIPTGRLCAIQSGSVQCYGEDGSFGLGVGTLYEDSGAISGRERGPAVAMEARRSETHIRCPARRSEIHALTEGDNGALLIAMRSGIRQLVDGKAEAYPLPRAGPQLQSFIRCSGIAMAVFGSERLTGGYCMYTREGRMCLRSLTVSQAIPLKISLRIVKGIFG